MLHLKTITDVEAVTVDCDAVHSQTNSLSVDRLRKENGQQSV